MPCCSQCAGIEEEFNARVAARELRQFHRRGPGAATRMLLEAIRARGVTGLSLLDIGGGVGVIQHELVRAGIDQITSVDASSSYVAVQRAEAERLGYTTRATHLTGDFVALADRIPDIDIVTLDRVICCYPDMRSLVSLSAARARRLYGIVYPRGTWWNAVGFRLMNLVMRLRRRPFRGYLHTPREVDAIVRAQGLHPQVRRHTLIWNVAVYAR